MTAKHYGNGYSYILPSVDELECFNLLPAPFNCEPSYKEFSCGYKLLVRWYLHRLKTNLESWDQ